MDASPRRRGAWPAPVLSKGRLVWRSALWCIVVVAVAPCTLEAQNVERAAVDSTHADYLEAYRVYQNARSTWDEVTARWEDLFDQLARANERGDEAAKSRLRPEMQATAEERTAARNEFRRAEADWYAAGRELIRIVGEYQLDLINPLLAADEETQDALLDEYNEMNTLRDEVEDQMGPQEPLTLPGMPNLEALPENTQEERRRKLASVENHVATLRRWLEELGTEIDRLANDLQSENIMRAWERDAAGRRNLPTGVGGAGAGGTGADTTEVDLDEPTLAQQIETLKQQEGEVEDDLKRLEDLAAELRRRLGGTP